MKFKHSIHIVSICAMLLCTAAGAEDKPTTVDWSAKDTSGAAVTVPAKDKPSVLVFARMDQPQSAEALSVIKDAIKKSEAQVIVIFSGESADEQAKSLKAGGAYNWPTVVDLDYSSSGKLGVHVWPTTLVINAKGEQLAHLAGMAPTFPADLSNYLEFAGGRIDGTALAQRLTTRQTVTDGDDQKAARHLQVARRLFDSADIAGAKAEVESGLKLQPGQPDLQLLAARVQLAQDSPKDAIDTISQIKPGSLPGWQTALVKTWALVALGKWEDARATSSEALKLNPQPAEAYYLTGLIRLHDKDAAAAAEAFKKSFEETADGKKLSSIVPEVK